MTSLAQANSSEVMEVSVNSHAPGEGLDALIPLLFGKAQPGVIERGP